MARMDVQDWQRNKGKTNRDSSLFLRHILWTGSVSSNKQKHKTLGKHEHSKGFYLSSKAHIQKMVVEAGEDIPGLLKGSPSLLGSPRGSRCTSRG